MKRKDTTPTLPGACELNTLKLESDSFLEDDLRLYYNDALYSLQAGKGKGYVYCVIEHQSAPIKPLPFVLPGTLLLRCS